MISNLFTIGSRAIANAQVSINNTSNNIANAETSGYQRTDTNYSSTGNITVSGSSIGTGAEISSITANWDSFVEAQYLTAAASLSGNEAVADYLAQMEELLNESDEDGLGTQLDAFLDAWSDLSTDPDSTAEREALLGEAESLVYALNSTSSELLTMKSTIEDEIQSQVDEANEYIDTLASLNKQISADPDNTDLVSSRAQIIRELDELIGIETETNSNGQTSVYTDNGLPLVDGTTTHHLAYSSSQSNDSLMPDSDYDGEINYSGSSSEEIMIEFVSSGTDGTAQFKVSFDGGNSWAEDDNGNTILYTASDSSSPVEIDGVEIYFSGGTTDHETGDRYTIVPKTGLYWEKSSGALVNCTPLTDSNGDDTSNRVTGGSIAGLFKVRDDDLLPTLDELDALSSGLIYEVNSAHSQGAGLESHTSVTGTYTIEDQTAALSDSGLIYDKNIEDGSFEIYAYDSDGAVISNSSISIDASTDSLNDIISQINSDFSGILSASITSDGTLKIQAQGDYSFEFGSDSTGFLAAAGINTFFEGSNAADITVNSYIQENSSHINCGEVGDNGTVSAGSNSSAESISSLLNNSVNINTETSSTTQTLSSYLSSIVSKVGASAQNIDTQIACDTSAAQLYYDQQESVSGVNVEEEVVNLTKYQQQYQAACQIITVTQTMFDSILDMM
ncbi:flagellar hook-associated protein FlgK [Maridesulfovibrio bastinii]|uniref:flagellar hook-associated protein FlgK n=1 Tax=Maridesulfovibrio bastinii TaxID=47157 RepID=UPI000405B5DD|nr:flagellar hook-associated protein FlgK [Maridesulfovibrio bastinii]